MEMNTHLFGQIWNPWIKYKLGFIVIDFYLGNGFDGLLIFIIG